MSEDKVPELLFRRRQRYPFLQIKQWERQLQKKTFSVFDKITSNASKLDHLFFSGLKILVIILLIVFIYIIFMDSGH